MNNDVLFSSKKIDWETPKLFFDECNKEFNFTLDPCASVQNAKCKKFYTEKENGLNQDWGGGETVFCNPPYGRQLPKWIEKCFNKGRLKFGDSKNSAPFPSMLVIYR